MLRSFAVMACLLALVHESAQRYRVCLSAIVRDEARVIERFLTNNRFAFDRFDIVDTGSVDATPALVDAFLATHAVRGAVHRFTWTDDFGEARSFALERSREAGCQHIVAIDADEEIWHAAERRPLRDEAERARFAAHLRSRCAALCTAEMVTRASMRWRRIFAMSADKPWQFEGARHEFINAHGVPASDITDYAVYAHRDQSRLGRDPNALLKDGAALERDVARGLNIPRALYYAGQSYEQGGDAKRALEMYRQRVARTDGWSQERFVAQWHIGLLVQREQGFSAAAIAEYFAAMAIDASRAEPYYHLALGFRGQRNYAACFALANEGRRRRLSPAHLFANAEAFEFGALDEAAVCASYLPEYRVTALDYALQLLNRRPNEQRVRDNMLWLNATLRREFDANTLPSAQARKRLLQLWKNPL